MTWKTISQTVLILIISTIALIAISLMIYLIAFNLFDTTTTIQAYNRQTTRNLGILFTIAITFIFVIDYYSRLNRDIKYLAAIFPAIILMLIIGYQYINLKNPIKEFDKNNWSFSERGQFIEARSIVLSNSFDGRTKFSVLKSLGKPNDNSEENLLIYDIYNDYDWTFSIHFEDDIVTKTEMTKHVDGI